MVWLTAALLAALLMFGCRGAYDSSEQATQFAGRMYAGGVAPATQQAAILVTAEMVLDWVEVEFPDLLPKSCGERFHSIKCLSIQHFFRAHSGA